MLGGLILIHHGEHIEPFDVKFFCMWSTAIRENEVWDPLEQYHETIQRHETLIRPQLDRLREQMDASLSKLRRQEQQHLLEQQQALVELRKRLLLDARFVLHSSRFLRFVEQIDHTARQLPPALRMPLSKALNEWIVESLPLPLQILSCQVDLQRDYEEERDCVREVFIWSIRIGVLSISTKIERKTRFLGEHREVPLVYQHQELSFNIAEHLQKFDLAEMLTRQLACEIAAVLLYTAPLLLSEPRSLVLLYP